MTNHKLTLEQLLYIAIMVVALAVRFLRLGANPLSDTEAALALQALGLANGSPVLIGSQPGYVLWSSALFAFMGSSNFLARFWPALFGSLIVAIPYLLRERLGRKTALVLALALAIDPGLAAISRQAGGLAIAISAVGLAVGFWLQRKPVMAGIFAGLALLGGPGLWQGLIGLGLSYGLYYWFSEAPRKQENQDHDAMAPGEADAKRGFGYREAIFGAAGALLVAGTLFFRTPQGLSAAAQSLAVYWQGWLSGQGESPLKLIAALLAYEPLAWIFALVRLLFVREKDLLDRFLGWWLLTALLMALIYPLRQVTDLAWALLPLWALAARQLASLVALPDEHRTTAIVFAAVVFLALAFNWENLAGMANAAGGPQPDDVRWFAVMGVFVFVLIAALLVGWGWSGVSARKGLGWGIAAGFLVYTLNAAWFAAGIKMPARYELWETTPLPAQANLMTRVLGQLSDWNTGTSHSLDVLVAGISSPALRWELRNFTHASFVDYLSPGTSAAVVITPAENEPALAASYRGESFVWTKTPEWSSLSPYDWLPWLVSRQVLTQESSLILWAKTSLFPGAGTPGQQDSVTP